MGAHGGGQPSTPGKLSLYHRHAGFTGKWYGAPRWSSFIITTKRCRSVPIPSASKSAGWPRRPVSFGSEFAQQAEVGMQPFISRRVFIKSKASTASMRRSPAASRDLDGTGSASFTTCETLSSGCSLKAIVRVHRQRSAPRSTSPRPPRYRTLLPFASPKSNSSRLRFGLSA